MPPYYYGGYGYGHHHYYHYHHYHRHYDQCGQPHQPSCPGFSPNCTSEANGYATEGAKQSPTQINTAVSRDDLMLAEFELEGVEFPLNLTIWNATAKFNAAEGLTEVPVFIGFSEVNTQPPEDDEIATGGIIIIILVCLCCCASCAGCVYCFFRKKRHYPDSSSDSDSDDCRHNVQMPMSTHSVMGGGLDRTALGHCGHGVRNDLYCQDCEHPQPCHHGVAANECENGVVGFHTPSSVVQASAMPPAPMMPPPPAVPPPYEGFNKSVATNKSSTFQA